MKSHKFPNYNKYQNVIPFSLSSAFSKYPPFRDIEIPRLMISMMVDLYLDRSLLIFFVREFWTSWPLDSACTYWDINNQSSKLYTNKRGEGFVAIPSYTLISLFPKNDVTHAHTYTNAQNMSIRIIKQ